jgi:hypothetical protein
MGSDEHLIRTYLADQVQRVLVDLSDSFADAAAQAPEVDPMGSA